MAVNITKFVPKKVGVIGCGLRAAGVIYELYNLDSGAVVTDICDFDHERAKSLLKEVGVDSSAMRFWSDAREMLDKAELDGVIVATMWESHAELTELVLERNIPLFLEKPITFEADEMRRIHDAYDRSNKLAMISHPLTVSPLMELVKQLIDDGRVGTVEHIMAFNYVAYGGIYFHSKYRKCGRHGLFYEKSTHDFDWINYIMNDTPVRVAAMATQSVFGGDEPEAKLCETCDKQLTCMESPFMQKNFAADSARGEFCSFAGDVSTYDSASVLIEYRSGRHANYIENHMVRKGAGARGGRITGYSGTLEFDWISRSVKVFRHHNNVTETHKLDNPGGHLGGDARLMYDFVKMMHGVNDTAVSMERGLTTNYMAMATHESLETKTFATVKSR